MKRIDLLIHPAQWEEARSVLEGLAARVTLREVRSFGRTPPKREVFRGSAYLLELSTELELTILVEDALVESAVHALERVGQSGELVISTVEGMLPLPRLLHEVQRVQRSPQANREQQEADPPHQHGH
ncbi:MAG TPA: P-II family nitrogen regulator [Polyangiaceae bacterium]|nr:P-II family nitrogen regulator [Polyangiaceae bacterium]